MSKSLVSTWWGDLTHQASSRAAKSEFKKLEFLLEVHLEAQVVPEVGHDAGQPRKGRRYFGRLTPRIQVHRHHMWQLEVLWSRRQPRRVGPDVAQCPEDARPVCTAMCEYIVCRRKF